MRGFTMLTGLHSSDGLWIRGVITFFPELRHRSRTAPESDLPFKLITVTGQLRVSVKYHVQFV